MVLNPNYNSDSEQEWEVLPEDVGNDNEGASEEDQPSLQVEESPNATNTADTDRSTNNLPEETTAADTEEQIVEAEEMVSEEKDLEVLEEDSARENVENEQATNIETAATIDAPPPAEDENPQQEREPLLRTEEVECETNAAPTEATIDPEVLAALDPEERANLLEDQRKIMEQLESEKNQNSKPPSRSPLVGFLGSSLRQLGNAVKDIDNKHHITRQTKNSFVTVGNAVKDIDNKHHISRKTKNSFVTVGNSVRQVGQTIGEETKQVGSKIGEKSQQVGKVIQTEADKLHESVKQVCVEHDVKGKAKAVGENIKSAAKTAGQKARRLNEEHKVTDFLAAAAVVGAGVLLAKGHGRAGASVLATGGAAYVAGEAMRQPYRQDEGLNEHMHME